MEFEIGENWIIVILLETWSLPSFMCSWRGLCGFEGQPAVPMASWHFSRAEEADSLVLALPLQFEPSTLCI